MSRNTGVREVKRITIGKFDWDRGAYPRCSRSPQAARRASESVRNDQTVLEGHNAICAPSQIVVVRRNQCGSALVADELAKGLKHQVTRRGIEVAGRFVCEDNAWTVGSGACDGNALLLASL